MTSWASASQFPACGVAGGRGRGAAEHADHAGLTRVRRHDQSSRQCGRGWAEEAAPKDIHTDRWDPKTEQRCFNREREILTTEKRKH